MALFWPKLSWRLSRGGRQDLCDRKRWYLKNCFAILLLFLICEGIQSWFESASEAQNIHCDNGSFVILSFTHILTVRSCLQNGPATALASYRPKWTILISQMLKSGLEQGHLGSGQEVWFGPFRPDPGRNARDQDGTRTGRDDPHPPRDLDGSEML